ncbi:hypothetical protein DV736_g2129, partial [Chaetothyriales sp. CBS 134916]
MTTVVEGLYIFTADTLDCVLSHIYALRPPSPTDVAARLETLPSPVPALVYLADLLPPTTVHTLNHAGLLLCITSSRDGSSLALLAFLQRVADIFEDFLGSPLLATNIESNYSVVAQLLTEMCDGGIICNTEPNALHEQVDTSSGLVNKLLNQVGIPHAAAPALGSTSSTGLTNLKSSLSSSSANGTAIPWRRPNVRHTSNEVYVDILESLSLLLAPSGRPMRYLARGSILFTCKISGVPDLVLTLSAPGGTSSSKTLGIQRAMTFPSFHPCVRLKRWKENPGELSFIPPDGKFVLASYETDLMPSELDDDEVPGKNEKVFVPASVDLRTGLGAKGNEFEAKLRLDSRFAGTGRSSRPGIGASSSKAGSVAPFGFAVVVHIPFGENVRTVTELKASRGEANWVVKARSRQVEWKVSTSGKDGSVSGTAVLTGVVMGAPGHDGADDNNNGATADANADKRALSEYYDEATAKTKAWSSSRSLMPRSISVSFTVKGWLASGIRVDSLTVDAKKSRGLGESVRPYKGVKYVSVSRQGVERRVEQ